jgi:hypothetical protein
VHRQGNTEGRAIDAEATLLAAAETKPMLKKLVAKYGLRGFFSTLGPRYFGVPGAGIAITVPA